MNGHTRKPRMDHVESGTLDEVYRRLARVHATLAEADRVDEDLHSRTLDWLMDIMEHIDAASSHAAGAPDRHSDGNATEASVDRIATGAPWRGGR